MNKYFVLFLVFMSHTTFSQGDYPEMNKCVSGDCENGYGEYVFYTEGAGDLDIHTYIGDFKNGKFHGKGEIKVEFEAFQGDTGSEMIYGNWKNGLLHGKVTSVSRSQMFACDVEGWNSTYTRLLEEVVWKFDGKYKDGKKHGLAIEHYQVFVYLESKYKQITGKPSVEIYIGEFNEDKKNGFGTFIYSNGDIYKGKWFNDKRHGSGFLICNDGSLKNGVWKDDKLLEQF